jgi:cytidylate kinase
VKEILYIAGFAYTGKSVLARRAARLLDCGMVEVSDIVREAVRKRKVALDRETLQNSNTVMADNPTWLEDALVAAVRVELLGKERVVVSGPREGKLIVRLEQDFPKATIRGIWIWTSLRERLARAGTRDGLKLTLEELLEIDGRDLELGVGTIERMCSATVDSSGHPIESSIALERVLHRMYLLTWDVFSRSDRTYYTTPLARWGIRLKTSAEHYRTAWVGFDARLPHWLRRLVRRVAVPLTVRAVDRLVQGLIDIRVHMAWLKEEIEGKESK